MGRLSLSLSPEREEFGVRINLEYNTIQYNVIKAEVITRAPRR